MARLLLLSIMVMMIWLPVHFSHARHAGVGLRRTLVGFLAYSLVYWFSVVIVYFTLILGRSPVELLSKTVHD